MAVETDTERAIFVEVDDFAVAATFGGGTVNGILDTEHLELDAGGTVGFAINEPRFLCRTSDVSSAAEGDAIIINATNYVIKVVQDDGTGMTTLVLEEQ